MTLVECACIYECVYVLFAEILDLYDSDDCAEDSDDSVEDSDDCVVPTRKYQRICNLEALQLLLRLPIVLQTITGTELYVVSC